MKCILRIFLSLFLLITAQGVLLSQEHRGPDWDELLDRYERICKMCLDLRVENGSAAEERRGQLSEVLNELNNLKNELSGLDDKLPAYARRRFAAIRQMYSNSVIEESRPAGWPSYLPLVMADPAAWAPPSGLTGSISPVVPLPAWHWTLSASFLALPEFSAGLMACYTRGKLGAYAAFRSNYSWHDTSYSALSDGTAGAGRIWTTGAKAVDRHFLTAGPAVKLTDRISFFGGLGYGSRRLCWEDSEGAWVEVSDASFKGLCTEFGASYGIGRCVVSASWLSLPFSYNALALSLGWSFGRYYR